MILSAVGLILSNHMFPIIPVFTKLMIESKLIISGGEILHLVSDKFLYF